MKPARHIEKLLKDCRQVQEHGHCEKNAAAFVAVSDIEIAVNDLRKALKVPKQNDSRREPRKGTGVTRFCVFCASLWQKNS